MYVSPRQETRPAASALTDQHQLYQHVVIVIRPTMLWWRLDEDEMTTQRDLNIISYGRFSYISLCMVTATYTVSQKRMPPYPWL